MKSDGIFVELLKKLLHNEQLSMMRILTLITDLECKCLAIQRELMPVFTIFILHIVSQRNSYLWTLSIILVFNPL